MSLSPKRSTPSSNPRRCPRPTGRPSVSPFLLAGALLIFVSCARQQPATPPDTIKDDLGNPVPLKPVPGRIVSLAPNLTEILFALNLDSAVVGVTDYCDFPPAAATKPRVGGFSNPGFERIVALNPDLVLLTMAGNARADYEKLRSLGLRAFVTNPATVEGVFQSIRTIGTLTGETIRADSMVLGLSRIRDSLSSAARRRPEKSVLVLVSLRPVIAVGAGTYLHELIGLANGRNSAATSSVAYPMMNREHILSIDPDVIIATTDIAKTAGDVARAYPEWNGLRAVRNGQVHVLDGNVLSRPGPRIMEALALLVSAMH